MSSTAPVRVGLVGCGYQGQWLAEAIRYVDDMLLVACVDPDPKAVEKILQSVGGRSEASDVFPSVEVMLNNGWVDAVILATPHQFLCPFALRAIAAGKSVLAEKPIALNAKQARQVEKALVDAPGVFYSGYSFRFLDLPARANRILSEGAVGQIQTVNAAMILPALRAGWPSEVDSGGGMMGFFGSHIVDRVLWFMQDDPVEVFSWIRRSDTSGADITTVFQARFAGGAIVQFNLCASAEGPFDSLHFFGSEGHLSLVADAFPHYQLALRRKNQPVECYRAVKDRREAILEMTVPMLRDFGGAVRGCHGASVDIVQGRKVLDVLDAVRRSSLSGVPVSL